MDKNSVVRPVDRYISVWNETDDAARQVLVADVFVPNAVYVDPNIVADGVAAIGSYIAGARRNFAGMLFTHGTVLAHHDAAHFSWEVGPPGGAPVVSGFDVALVENGRISRLYGFFNGY